MKDQNQDFEVECATCKQRLMNWVGSTPCCGSIAYIVEDNKATESITLFAEINNEPITAVVLNFETPKT